MKKRALSWLLALTMLLTLAPQTLPVWASATGEKSNTATQTESKLSANTYSALGLSRNVADSEKPKDQPYGKAEVGNTIATNVINELYVNFNGSIHYGWSILDNLTMQYKTNISDWTSSGNFYGAMGYWRPNQQPVHYGTGNTAALGTKRRAPCLQQAERIRAASITSWVPPSTPPTSTLPTNTANPKPSPRTLVRITTLPK